MFFKHHKVSSKYMCSGMFLVSASELRYKSDHILPLGLQTPSKVPHAFKRRKRPISNLSTLRSPSTTRSDFGALSLIRVSSLFPVQSALTQLYPLGFLGSQRKIAEMGSDSHLESQPAHLRVSLPNKLPGLREGPPDLVTVSGVPSSQLRSRLSILRSSWGFAWGSRLFKASVATWNLPRSRSCWSA